jgi:hypothetical protein
VSAVELLPLIRDLFSKHPEMLTLEAWEMQSALFVLGYTDELESEAEIAAAVEVARQDYPQWRPAAGRGLGGRGIAIG